jgi:uncharacterized protein
MGMHPRFPVELGGATSLYAASLKEAAHNSSWLVWFMKSGNPRTGVLRPTSEDPGEVLCSGAPNIGEEMTPQEESMLNDLIGRVEQTQLTEKDPEAEQLLNQRLAPNPNALYILSQTVLVQKYALEQAKSQIDQLRQLQQAPPQPAHATSFLGSLLGHRDPVPPAPPQPPPPAPPAYGQPPYAQPWNPAPTYGAPPQPGGTSSFLRTAATTAAGVAAGALAFQGVESLMHGFGHPGGFGGGGYFGGGVPEETVVNNYYDDAGRQSGAEGRGERLDNSSLGDSGSDAASLQQASDNLKDGPDDTDDQDDLSLDDASYDDSSLDDSDNDDSSYDDSASDGDNDLA